MENKNSNFYTLGLDIGANSIGWAVLQTDEEENPIGLLGSGVRIFEAGAEGDIESGREESRAKPRREARLARRRLDRLARRLNKLFYALQSRGLMPPETPLSEDEIKYARMKKALTKQKIITELDKQLLEKWSGVLTHEGLPQKEARRLAAKKLPYILRAKALDEKLDLFELGRAIYHLAQRRGFLSNRIAEPKDEEELGKVKAGISELSKRIEESGSRTLGEYFSKLDPEEERIRGRWTSRQMYMDEFGQIWAAQKKHYPEILTDEFKATLFDIIFYQRPLKEQTHLIGKCELENEQNGLENQPRAPMALLDAQRFRLLQKVNDTRIRTIESDWTPLPRDLAQKLVAELETREKMTVKEVRKFLGLEKDIIINFERSDPKYQYIGNRTAAKLISIFGLERWRSFSKERQDSIVQDILSDDVPGEELKRRGIKWGLDEDAAQRLADLVLESGYCNLSLKAIKKLLPLMEKGIPYASAVLEVYDFPAPEPLDYLPPVVKVLPEIRNPVVMRALTELRRVVNHIIKRFGKPSRINVELARELKKNKKERKTLTEKIKKNESAREKARKEIMKEAGIPEEQISRADTEKYLLAEECNWECPYTGRKISMGNLFGPNPQFDVEHIIPFHRSFDNSFFNKTLCYHEENRLVKRGRTPFEAYGHNPTRWEEILHRVKQFKGEAASEKLKRFTMKNLESLEDFTTRQLNDTRYASKLARRYLSVLYGVKEKEAQKYIKANKGQITAHIRNALDLNRILGNGAEKSRDDHRHHAIDAIAIALTTPSITKRISDVASRSLRPGGWKNVEVPKPWDTFYADVVQSINNIIVSHRISRKVSGPLHEETIYSPPKISKDGKSYVHVRKRLDALSTSEINEIVDPVVQKIVLDKFNELGGGDPKKVFSDPQNHPFLTAKDGRKIPIHKVRIRKTSSPFKIGNGPNERDVVHKSNHHLEIIEVTDKKGRKKWEGVVVSMYEAYLRKKQGLPIVQRDHGEGKKFLFSLANKDTIEIDDEKGKRELFIVRSLWEDMGSARISFTSIIDARPLPELKKGGALKSARMEPLRKANCRKVIITPLGEIRWAND